MNENLDSSNLGYHIIITCVLIMAGMIIKFFLEQREQHKNDPANFDYRNYHKPLKQTK